MSTQDAAVAALLTNIVLVLITGVYVVLTWRLGRSSERAARAAAESAAASRASLVVDFELIGSTAEAAGPAPELRGVLVANTGKASVFLHDVFVERVDEFAGARDDIEIFVTHPLGEGLSPPDERPVLLHPGEHATLPYVGKPITAVPDLVVGRVHYSLSGVEPVFSREHSVTAAMSRFSRWRQSRSVPYPGSGRFP